MVHGDLKGQSKIQYRYFDYYCLTVSTIVLDWHYSSLHKHDKNQRGSSPCFQACIGAKLLCHKFDCINMITTPPPLPSKKNNTPPHFLSHQNASPHLCWNVYIGKHFQQCWSHHHLQFCMASLYWHQSAKIQYMFEYAAHKFLASLARMQVHSWLTSAILSSYKFRGYHIGDDMSTVVEVSSTPDCANVEPFKAQVGQYVAAVYDNAWYLAIVLEISGENDDILLAFMKPKGPARSFSWPRRKDQCWVPSTHVLTKISGLTTVTGRQYKLQQEELRNITDTFQQCRNEH